MTNSKDFNKEYKNRKKHKPQCPNCNQFTSRQNVICTRCYNLFLSAQKAPHHNCLLCIDYGEEIVACQVCGKKWQKVILRDDKGCYYQFTGKIQIPSEPTGHQKAIFKQMEIKHFYFSEPLFTKKESWEHLNTVKEPEWLKRLGWLFSLWILAGMIGIYPLIYFLDPSFNILSICLIAWLIPIFLYLIISIFIRFIIKYLEYPYSQKMLEIAKRLHRRGVSAEAIAAALDRAGYVTGNRKEWDAKSVKKLLRW